jgi:diadenosine tetraphosphatase ApaH/serine/threonine PP2A family protein phosphatase
MRYGIFSDIHGNLEALEAVLEELDRRQVDKRICLGDVVGYGPNPNECVELVRERADLVLAGNHDHAAIGRVDTTYFNIYARQAVEWTARQLTPESRAFLESLPFEQVMDDFTVVHSTPEEPERWDYLTSIGDALRNFPKFRGQACFIGHSHVPIIVAMRANGECAVERRNPLHFVDGERYIINVGSVGQPRDMNPDAAFGIYEDDARKYELCRVPYDVAATQKKIINAGLPYFLAERLERGQ